MVAERTGEAGGGGGGGLVCARRAWIAATVVESGASERGLVLGGGAGKSLAGWTCGVGHVLARGEGEVVLAGGALEDPADASLLNTVGSAWWGGGVSGGIDAGPNICACLNVYFVICYYVFDISTCCSRSTTFFSPSTCRMR